MTNVPAVRYGFNPATGGFVVDIAEKVLPQTPAVLYTLNACSISPLPNPAYPCTPVLDASQVHFPTRLRYTDSNLGFSNYQDLELQLAHRISSGFYLQATYDWAKNLSNLGDNPVGYGTEAGNFSGNYLVNDQYALRDGRGHDPQASTAALLIDRALSAPIRAWQTFPGEHQPFCKRRPGRLAAHYDYSFPTGPFMTANDINPADSAANLNELNRGTTIRPDQIGNCNISNRGRMRAGII